MKSNAQESPRSGEETRHSVIDLSKQARQCLRERKYAEAKELFLAGLEIEPDNPYLLSGMGDACRESGDFPEAERCYRALLAVDKENLFALRGLGDVCKKLTRHQEAIKLWESYLALRPKDKHVMTRIADSLKVLQQYEKAERVYKQILAIAPRDRFALTGLADLQHRLGKDAEAIRTYEKVLRFNENDLHILTIVGKLCWRISDFDRAQRCFAKALAVDPRNPYALYGLGNCYRWSREYEKALDIWERILEESEGTQALHVRMGDAYCHVGRIDAAEQAYIKSLTFGDDPFSRVGLICLYALRKEWEAAEYHYGLLVDGAKDAEYRLDLLVRRFLRNERQDQMVALLERLVAADDQDKTTLAIFVKLVGQSE